MIPSDPFPLVTDSSFDIKVRNSKDLCRGTLQRVQQKITKDQHVVDGMAALNALSLARARGGWHMKAVASADNLAGDAG